MSALGQKQTFAPQKAMSALPPKADMCGARADVRFGPIADIGRIYSIRLVLIERAAAVAVTAALLLPQSYSNRG
jgi:hypothetical protein